MLIRILNRIVSRWKGNEYKIDASVPSTYLSRLMIDRLFMLIRGTVRGFKNDGLLFISSSSTIKARSKIKAGRSVSIASGAYIDALSRNGIIFGNNVSVGKDTKIEATGNLQFLGKGLIVGNNVALGTDCFYGCAGGIEIGNDTIIGNFVSFHSENHVADDVNKLIRMQGVTHKGIKVGNNCWIGAKATILDGAVIEDGCIIAAGAVVRAGVYPENGIYGGVPAKLIKQRGA
ncbi:MAG: acyltransferase [Thermoleophilia bacterium]